MRSVLIALVAVCALGVVAASSASAALPEFVPNSGTFPVPFHGLTTGTQILETEKGTKVECTIVHTVGYFSDAHLGEIHILFLGCETSVAGIKGSCANKAPVPSSKEILVLGLFHFGYIEPSSKLVGVLINWHTSPLVSFECEVLGVKETVNVTGEVIGHVDNADLNTKLHSMTIRFNQTKGKQEFQQITLPLVSETELMTGVHLSSKVGSGGVEESGENSPDDELLLLPAAEEGEIKA